MKLCQCISLLCIPTFTVLITQVVVVWVFFRTKPIAAFYVPAVVLNQDMGCLKEPQAHEGDSVPSALHGLLALAATAAALAHTSSNFQT